MSLALRNIFKVVSIVFQPLLIPLYSLLLLSIYTDFFSLYKHGIRSFIFPVIILTFLIPSMFIIILKTTGYINDLTLSKAKDRTLPYLIFMISNCSLIYIFMKVNVPYWFLGYLGVPLFISFIGLIINFFFRISTYMLAIGATISTVIFISFVLEGINPANLLIVLFLIAGLIGVARLYLEKEKPVELYSGFIVGLLGTYLYFFLFILTIGFYFI